MAVLRPHEGGEYPLSNKITVIGRDPASDIVVPNAKASWRHAIVLHQNDHFYIEDLGSVNGTFVNGQRVIGRAPLSDGDEIELYGLRASFHLGLGDRPPPPEAATPDGGVEVPTDKELGIMSSLDMSSGLRVDVRCQAKLRAILEISEHTQASLELKDILPKILASLFDVFPQADRGFILLRDPDTGQIVPRAQRLRRQGEIETPALPPGATEASLPISTGVLRHVLETGRGVLSADAGADERFDPFQSVHRFHIHSVMCVPIVSTTGESLGAIQIDTKERGRQFCEDDLEVLICASAMVSRAVVLAQLHLERRELEAAVRIQKSFLPAGRPEVEELTFFDYYSSAKNVGGDYYDYIPLPGRRLAVALGDVSGKGVSAALLMARLSSAVRFALATEPSIPEAVRNLSRVLTRQEASDRFITFLVIVIDLNDYSAVLVNAGHMPPLLVRPGGDPPVTDLGEEIIGLPLAIFDRPYEQLSFQLQPGDRILLYTDGVTEARNPRGELFGSKRLHESIADTTTVEEMGQVLLRNVRAFGGERSPSDDLTIVCFGRNAETR